MATLRSWWTIAWRVVLFIGTWALLYAPFTLILLAYPPEDVEGTSWIIRLYFDVSGLASILVASWILLRFLERRKFSTLGFEPRSLVIETSLGAAIGLGMVSLCLMVTWLGGWTEVVPQAGVSVPALILASLSLLLNAALQELLCRGYVFQAVHQRAGLGAALLLTSLFFAALHAGAIQGSGLAALNLFCAGVLLGLAYAWTSNLWMPIALHFVWNLALGPLLGLSVSGQSLDAGHTLVRLSGPEIWTGGSFGIEASLSATLATLAAIVLLILLRRKAGSPLAPDDSSDRAGEQPRG